MEIKEVSKIKRDEFGPEFIVEVYDPKTEMRGVVVIDNRNLGPGKGGIRMTKDVDTKEVFRLARTMTWKNALAGIPFGGAKGGMRWIGGDNETKKKQVESFAKALSLFMPEKYIAGPDVNSGEKEMDWFAMAVSNPKVATGKSKEMGGLPHELGSTGFGVAKSAITTVGILGKDIKDLTVAIEGFGNVGSFAFKHLAEAGAKIVSVADSRGATYLPEGLSEETIIQLRNERKPIGEYSGGRASSREEFFALSVDLMILATVTDVINDENKNIIKAKIIVEGSNIPMKEEIERELWNRGVIIVPDMVANAGGVISSYCEHIGLSPDEMFKMVEEKIVNSTKMVMEKAINEGVYSREVAMEIAKEIVRRG